MNMCPLGFSQFSCTSWFAMKKTVEWGYTYPNQTKDIRWVGSGAYTCGVQLSAELAQVHNVTSCYFHSIIALHAASSHIDGWQLTPHNYCWVRKCHYSFPSHLTCPVSLLIKAILGNVRQQEAISNVVPEQNWISLVLTREKRLVACKTYHGFCA